jgi:hypothetical protein
MQKQTELKLINFLYIYRIFVVKGKAERTSSNIN